MKRRWIWFALMVALLLPLTGCSVSRVDVSVWRMMSQVDEGNYINAADIYMASIYGNTEREYKVKQELDARLTQALNDYNTGEKSYDEANNVIETIDRINVPDYTALYDAYSGLLTLQQSKAAFDSAEALFASGLYSDALENYLAVLEEDTNYAAAQQKATEARECFLAELDSRLNEYLDGDDYVSALNLLDEARLMLPDEVSLDARETEIRAKYLNYALEQAKTVFSAGKDYESAIRVITSAQNRLGDNDRLAAALAEYQSCIPVYLNDLDYIDKEGELFLATAPHDNYGNEYKYSLYVSNWGNTYVTYYLNGNYTNLSGTCAVSENRKTSDSRCYFEIFGDGVLLYRSNTMAKGDAPYNFSIDVTGITKLTIDYPYEDNVGSPAMATICDGLLTK